MPGSDFTKVIITGATGGLGSVLARHFAGQGYQLTLVDRDEESLKRLVASFGRSNAGHSLLAGDIADDALIARIAEHAAAGDGGFACAHAAGVSPSMADWRTIMSVNLIATAKLAEALAPLIQPGGVMLAIGSIAGYVIPDDPARDAILDQPLAHDLFTMIEPYLRGLAGDGDEQAVATAAYRTSKRGVVRLAQQLAPAWGRRGARIATVSPSFILSTPMGQVEAAANQAVAGLKDATPLGRLGSEQDIIDAIVFMMSDKASFITGCDLRVDGGLVAAQTGPRL